MKKVYKLEQLDELKQKYSREMIKEAEEIIIILIYQVSSASTALQTAILQI